MKNTQGDWWMGLLGNFGQKGQVVGSLILGQKQSGSGPEGLELV